MPVILGVRHRNCSVRGFARIRKHIYIVIKPINLLGYALNSNGYNILWSGTNSLEIIKSYKINNIGNVFQGVFAHLELLCILISICYIICRDKIL